MLAILAFSLSLIGTFIVRSGLLTSVHSFAALRIGRFSIGVPLDNKIVSKRRRGDPIRGDGVV